MRAADLPLLFSIVEHRAWTLGIEAALRGDKGALAHDQSPCRFDEWLRTEAESLCGAGGALASIVRVHEDAHVLADKLCDEHSRGRGVSALERLPELTGLCQRMSDEIEALIDKPAR